MNNKRLIAYYLPQFHQIPENDKWWGEGYTEWTALKSWKPYFKTHEIRKPQVDALGYYNLMDLNVIEKQYEIASRYNIEGFCIWTYWFGGGKRLLEGPLNLLLSKQNKVRYCIAWANHSWFNKSTWTMLQKQEYLGENDYRNFFYEMLPHFKNENYIKENNKPLVSIFMIKDIPDLELFINVWNDLAIKEGFNGIFFVSDQYDPSFKSNHLLDGFTHSPEMFRNRNMFQKIIERLIRYHNFTFLGPMKYSYPKMMKNLFKGYIGEDKFIPTIFSGWDTTPRHGLRGVVLNNFNKISFGTHVRSILDLPFNSSFIFIKSWNEWAEGNVLEPDDINGEKLLECLKK